MNVESLGKTLFDTTVEWTREEQREKWQQIVSDELDDEVLVEHYMRSLAILESYEKTVSDELSKEHEHLCFDTLVRYGVCCGDIRAQLDRLWEVGGARVLRMQGFAPNGERIDVEIE